MPEQKLLPVKDLALDLNNYRTVAQRSEAEAVEAMILTSPDRFWALTDSLLRDGYLPTENIIVVKTSGRPAPLTVREGNRRIAALKLLHGLLPTAELSVPAEVLSQIQNVPQAWREVNKTVPCTVFEPADEPTVDRIVTLAHGKGEKASRDQWNAVARARHNRNVNKRSEPALDLLEKYLTSGKNSTTAQKARWAGDYPLSVLEEAMKRLAPRLTLANAPALAAAYPGVPHRDAVEEILFDIGQGELDFDDIRGKSTDFAAAYGILTSGSSGAGGGAGGGASGGGAGASGSGAAQNGAGAGTGNLETSGAGAGGGDGGAAGGGSSARTKAVQLNDPRAVKRALRAFHPKGKNREKVATLKAEAEKLDISKTPFAFTFVLRSMFEISAKVYCKDHAAAGGPTAVKADGSDRNLVDVLREVTNHLTKNNSDKAMVRTLTGAMAELAKPSGLLSVTSMNQLIHNPTYSVTPGDLALTFGNVFPLLQAMNQ